MSDSLRPHGPYSPWNSPGHNTGLGSLSLLQGIFPIQGWNPGFPHCRRILYQLSHKGSPRILEWVAYSFSRGSSPPKDQTQVSCIVGRRFTVWATREAQPETKSTSSTLQVDSLPFEPPGKLMNTGVGSLFLLQEVFPAQESNWGLLHCGWILYQLSYLLFYKLQEIKDRFLLI